jgi:hypothetical protein
MTETNMPPALVPKRGRGRPRKHKNNAEKQDAYRKRKQEAERLRLVAQIKRRPLPELRGTADSLAGLHAYSGAGRSRVRSHPGQQSEMIPVTVPG